MRGCDEPVQELAAEQRLDPGRVVQQQGGGVLDGLEQVVAVLLRVLPSIIGVLFVLTVAVTALRLTGRPGVGVVATALALVGQRQRLRLPVALFPREPHLAALALGAPTLLTLVTLLALRWRGELHRAAYVLVPFLAIIASGTKGSTTPILVAGLALAAVAMLLWKRDLLVPVVVDGIVDVVVVVGASLVLVLVLVVGASLVLVLVLVVVFHGSSAGLALGVTESAKQTGLAVVLAESRRGSWCSSRRAPPSSAA